MRCRSHATLNPHLVLQSTSFRRWQFCGWFDAELSEKGKEEATAGGKAIADSGIKFDLAYTSVLQRANVTLDTILAGSDQSDVPTTKTWRLNERHYGGLTGKNKAETVEKFGEAQVRSR
jgi:2,3-bisphosphoglycerate-dependent phosphoglycerate mutase